MPDSDKQDTFNIGQKLKVARKQHQLSLRELADRAEVSASLLSKIENNKTTPSVRSLYSIAEALSLPVNYFFPQEDQADSEEQSFEQAPDSSNNQPQKNTTTVDIADMTPSEFRKAQAETALDGIELGFNNNSPPAKEPIVRAEARQSIELQGGIIWDRLTPHLEKGTEFLQICYEVGATSGKKMSHHKGREFHYILKGQLLLELGFERYLLKPGDSIIFDSTTPHRLSNTGTVPMRAISVIFTGPQQ